MLLIKCRNTICDLEKEIQKCLLLLDKFKTKCKDPLDLDLLKAPSKVDDAGDDVVGVTDEAEAAITNVLHYG